MDLSRLAEVFFNLDVAQRYLPDILRGAWITVSISVGVVITGVLAGLLLAVARLVSPRWVVEIIRLWVDSLRALPPLALVLLLFFGLPSLGITLSAAVVIWLILSCVLAAFSEEIFWAGITAIGQGQWEASRSTGMTHGQTLRYVILPQAFKICVPPLTNRAIAITKNTALGTAIGMPEMLNQATVAQSFSGNATPLVLASIGYLIIFMPLMALASIMEKRMAWGAKS
jgi:polar amino acid transport system permease protein